MRLLLAVCLCFTSTTLAVGDENFKRVEDPIDDVQTPGAPISAPVPDPISAPTRRPPVDSPVDDLGLGGDAPRFEQGAKAEATEWHPRLLIALRPSPQIDVVIPKNSLPNVEAPIASSSDPKGFIMPPSDLAESGESTVTLKAWRTSPGEWFSLYCDTVTVNISQEGNTPTYQLECKSRVHISTEGFSVNADSASLKDGRCELVNARINNGVVSATAANLTLALPIRGISTNDFGRPIPKSQPTEKEVTPSPEKEVTPSPDKGNTFNRDIGT